MAHHLYQLFKIESSQICIQLVVPEESQHSFSRLQVDMWWPYQFVVSLTDPFSFCQIPDVIGIIFANESEAFASTCFEMQMVGVFSIVASCWLEIQKREYACHYFKNVFLSYDFMVTFIFDFPLYLKNCFFLTLPSTHAPFCRHITLHVLLSNVIRQRGHLLVCHWFSASHFHISKAL